MPGGGELKLVDYLPNVKAVFYAAGSVRYFANEYFEKGVRIFSAYAANAIPVAEYTVGQILLANKGFFQSSLLAKAGKHKEATDASHAHVGNYGANIGIGTAYVYADTYGSSFHRNSPSCYAKKRPWPLPWSHNKAFEMMPRQRPIPSGMTVRRILSYGPAMRSPGRAAKPRRRLLSLSSRLLFEERY